MNQEFPNLGQRSQRFKQEDSCAILVLCTVLACSDALKSSFSLSVLAVIFISVTDKVSFCTIAVSSVLLRPPTFLSHQTDTDLSDPSRSVPSGQIPTVCLEMVIPLRKRACNARSQGKLNKNSMSLHHNAGSGEIDLVTLQYLCVQSVSICPAGTDLDR